jgi:hypothetical protein
MVRLKFMDGVEVPYSQSSAKSLLFVKARGAALTVNRALALALDVQCVRAVGLQIGEWVSIDIGALGKGPGGGEEAVQCSSEFHSEVETRLELLVRG